MTEAKDWITAQPPASLLEQKETGERVAAMDQLLKDDGELYGDPDNGRDGRLLNCPFCGCLPWVHANRNAFVGHTSGGSMGWRVECEGKCHAMTCWWHSEAEAIEHWNLRADPPQTHGDVERVARAMYDARCAGKKNYCDFDDLSTNGYHDTYEVFMADAAAALSAMRPVVDQVKLAEIRERHEKWERDGFIKAGPTGAIHAHADREWLLSLIRGSHDD